MTYNCRLYRNSGFNENNIPDNPDILNSGSISFTDVPAIEVMQCRNLSKIRVKCSWKQARNVDYIRLIDDEDEWYYYASNPVMVATDVCEFEVVTDYISSTGGIENLSFLDGTTERVHVANDNQIYSCDGDPLLAPSEPMKVIIDFLIPKKPDEDAFVTVVESTVDPIKTLNNAEGKTYTDPDTQGTANIPQLSYIDDDTDYYIGHKPISGETYTQSTTTHQGTALFIVNVDRGADIDANIASVAQNIENALNPNIREAIANLRGLGVEQCIIRQFQYPISMVGLTASASQGTLAKVRGGDTFSSVHQYLLYPTNIESELNSDLGTFKNRLLAYSPLKKIGLLTTAGNSTEFMLEEVYNFIPNTHILVRYITDPRPDGKPYYRFNSVNGDNSFEGFWRNCVAGMPWKQVPLIFQGASGSLINTQKFENQQNIAAAQRHFDRAMAETTTLVGGVGGVLTAAGGALTGNATAVMGGIGAVGGSLAAAAREDFTQAQYERKRKSELYDFYTSQNAVVPTINFPYNSEIIRDTLGNGCICYMFDYANQQEKSRIDKLLTMYGYKIAKPLEKTDFTNRTKFNFVACNNVTVTGHAKWINEGIAEQLKAGVRVWHVLPNPSAYNDNPIA